MIRSPKTTSYRYTALIIDIDTSTQTQQCTSSHRHTHKLTNGQGTSLPSKANDSFTSSDLHQHAYSDSFKATQHDARANAVKPAFRRTGN